MIRALLAVLLTATQIALLSANAESAAAADSDITIAVSDETVRLGTKVTVSGQGPVLRRLVLQMKTRENGWQEVDSVTTGPSGTYSFRAPGWRGAHRLRVFAPATLLLAASVSDTRRVTVKVPYKPRGRASDWTWLSHRGARWDPCQTIGYRVNPRGSYRGATADVRRAFRQVGQVTGFRFEYLGRTTREVRRSFLGYHPAGTDVVVDWQSPKEEAGLAGRVLGIGGHWVQGGERFSGYMLLDRTERHPRGTWRQVMTHEVGHVVGLGHARSRRQLMYGVSSPLNVLLGAGDLAAFGRVGASQGCLGSPPAVPPRPCLSTPSRREPSTPDPRMLAMSVEAFRVGFVEGAMPDKWARIWRQRRRDPIELVPVSQAEQEDGIRSGSLDMALVRLPIDREGLHCIPLYDELAVAVAASDHYLAAADEVTHADIAEDEVDWSTIPAKDAVAVVANGDGVVVMPISLARLHHRKDAIHRPVTDLPPTTVGLSWLIDNDDERVQVFIGIVRGRTERSTRS